MCATRCNSSQLSYQSADLSESVLDITFGDALRSAAATWPTRLALVEGTSDRAARRRWTFEQLLTQSEAVARALSMHFSPGEHVAIWSSNVPEWVLIEFGAALAGLTLVTVNPAYLGDELAFLLKQSRACAVIVQDTYRDRDLLATVNDVRDLLPELREVIPLSSWSSFVEGGDESVPLASVTPDDVAQIQYTSGTTGRPKGARLTHRNLINNARMFARTIGAGDDDIWINPMPMFHTAGCSLCTLGALQTGGTHVLPPAFDPQHMLRLVEEELGTILLCVPTMLVRILDVIGAADRDLSSWRLVTLGGAPVPPELVRQAQLCGLKVAIGFGQTEASPYLTHTRPDDRHPDWLSTVGPPLPQTEIKIVNPNTGATVPRGEIGEICARGYSIMKDYLDDPEATSSVIDSEGWLHTGDLGSLDEYGYCRVQGRRKDMIIRGGENIYPREIEDVLHTHPAVLDASVVGVPDRDWGEVPVGFVQIRPGHQCDVNELIAFCRERLASYKVPRIWRFAEQFPQTASGKIQKFKLRERYLNEQSTSG
ncbi:AMP-binding protein [Bradyrhizobium sp. NBAIM03]|uniref:AMP-binding protein n=1 Tax=Bradyrhizobium sp. NBAIM03 TaxID=2793816 RepID=UPI001CD41B62|nr:AMP-binding protein [Bradyrhizobium sp. NBAIM03]MCA1536688.1 AMP-binding protein [Bradyrhizobium sp. NBAIM03]